LLADVYKTAIESILVVPFKMDKPLKNMDVWEKDSAGKRSFKYGKQNFRFAAETALECMAFTGDDDDERITDDNRSCYDCRYRRWTVDSFQCMKP